MPRLFLVLVLAACSSKSDPPPAKHEDRHDPPAATPGLELKVQVDGAAQTWAQDVFDKVPHATGKNNDGQDRDVWSLRELVHTAVGPNARIVAVVGDTRVDIDAAAWNDATRTPIVHRTRRGNLKFRWADKDGKWGDTVVKDVVELDVTR